MKKLFVLLLAWIPCAGFSFSTINVNNSESWAANAGWLNWRADSANGVEIGLYYCSGWIYSANLGWISLGAGLPANGFRYGNASAGDFGVNHDGFGNLRGYAYGANIGWIAFESNGSPTVDLQTGKLNGSIYSANCGWISLSNGFSFVQTDHISTGPDSDGDGIPDAFEYASTGSLAGMSAMSDLDGDGVSDRDEFLAGTDPVNPADKLSITAWSLDLEKQTIHLEWPAKSNRQYVVESRNTLDSESAWQAQTPLMTLHGGSNMTVDLTADAAATRFFRIRALLPLAPQ